MSLCCAVGTKNPVGLVATVFPEFVARDGQEPTNVGRQGNKRQVGAARRRSRGHGLARLDGTRTRATVADKVMKSEKMAGQATARSGVSPAGKRQRAGPKQASRAVGVRDGQGWPPPVPSGMNG
ncbi:hypothetical protein D3M96_05700 [Alcaligenes aquatilis]|uniref:Uncharacterized protein n=1 Tax=Alcaligenes aquatilis TaxID=323284 RepID=A0A3G2HT50_9BURK|nr:hypothetical protein D3M96_05700 [Alcaligenes aquatilis]